MAINVTGFSMPLPVHVEHVCLDVYTATIPATCLFLQ